MLEDDELDDLGRQRFTGRSLVAVHLNRPPEYINTFVAALSALIPPFTNVENRSEWIVFTVIGAAIIPYPSAQLKKLQDENQESLGGVSIGREQYLYEQATAISPPIGVSAPLAAMGVSMVHKGRVKVLILDSGMNALHPDFIQRNVLTLPFDNSGTYDPNGHGTHCTGLACGPATPSDGSTRYGVASESTVVTGKVISTTGQYDDSAILAGIKWAIEHGVVIINMSIEASVAINQTFNAPFELVARRALNAGILLVAAAGNAPAGTGRPVKHPANCPSVMAVGALDANLGLWDQSCVSINGGQYIDIAAPGVDVRSTDLGVTYSIRSGTSVASAFVSGVAALWADAPGSPRGQELWCALISSAIPVNNASYPQVGAGLVQAPLP